MGCLCRHAKYLLSPNLFGISIKCACHYWRRFTRNSRPKLRMIFQNRYIHIWVSYKDIILVVGNWQFNSSKRFMVCKHQSIFLTASLNKPKVSQVIVICFSTITIFLIPWMDNWIIGRSLQTCFPQMSCFVRKHSNYNIDVLTGLMNLNVLSYYTDRCWPHFLTNHYQLEYSKLNGKYL